MPFDVNFDNSQMELRCSEKDAPIACIRFYDYIASGAVHSSI